MGKTKKNVSDRIPLKDITGPEKTGKKKSGKDKGFKKNINSDIRYYRKLSRDYNKVIDENIRELKRYKWRLFTWPFLKKTAMAGITFAAIGFGSHTLYSVYSSHELDPKEKSEASYQVLEDRLTGLKGKYSRLQDEDHQKSSMIDKKENIIQKKDNTNEYHKSKKISSDEGLTRRQPSIVEEDLLQYERQEQVSKDRSYYYFPVRGDTLSKIASMISGDMSNWHRIQEYNNLPSDLIEVNQPLKVPPDLIRDASRLYHGSLDCRVYMAERGDDLKSVSEKLFGDSAHADDIYRFNRKFNPLFSERIWNKEHILIPKS